MAVFKPNPHPSHSSLLNRIISAEDSQSTNKPIKLRQRVYGHFLLRFDQNVECKRPAGVYPLRDFHKICRICTTFQDALAVKIWLDLLEGLWSYEGFKLKVSGYHQIFSAP